MTPHYSAANKRMLLGVALGYPIVAHYGFFSFLLHMFLSAVP